jgi:acetylglutamate kinase
LSGLDGKLIAAKKITKSQINDKGEETIIDYGLVGDPIGVNTGNSFNLPKI